MDDLPFLPDRAPDRTLGLLPILPLAILHGSVFGRCGGRGAGLLPGQFLPVSMLSRLRECFKGPYTAHVLDLWYLFLLMRNMVFWRAPDRHSGHEHQLCIDGQQSQECRG